MPAPYSSALAEALAPDVLERLLRYVRIDTQSARDRTQLPEHAGPARAGPAARRRAAARSGSRTPSRTPTATSSPRCPRPSRARR